METTTGEPGRPLPPPPQRPLPPILARRWAAWAVAAPVVVITQVIMWNGWNASGVWVSVTGWTGVFAYALYAAMSAGPVVLALFILRRWISLALVLVVLLVYARQAGQFFETSSSSTAAFVWGGPLIYGLPLVVLLCVTENVITWLVRGRAVRRRWGRL